jgi:hypothetical protein
MLAGKLGRAGGPSISPLRKTRGRGGYRQISTAGTCPLNLLRNSSPKHERPPHPSARASADLRVADTAAASPSFGWPCRGARKAARARPPRAFGAKNIFFAGAAMAAAAPCPLGRSSGKFFAGQRPCASLGRLAGASLGNRGASCGPCVPPRRLKDGDATLPGAAAPGVAAHTPRATFFGLRGLAVLAEGLRPRPAGHP